MLENLTIQQISRIANRFYRKTKRSEVVFDGVNCIEWLGGDDHRGYGSFFVYKKKERAHRFSYELHKGPIPPGDGYHGTCVLHACDNRKCVNPTHLSLGSNKDNVDDKVRKGRSPKGDNHSSTVYKSEVVGKIIELRKTGMTMKQIATTLNIPNHQTISRILGKTAEPKIRLYKGRVFQGKRIMAKNKAAVELGRKGGLKGGDARAKALTKKQRTAIATQGGKARVQQAKAAQGRKR